MFEANWPQTSLATVLSLLHNGCARLYRYVFDPVALLQSVLADGIRFTAVAGDAHCFKSSNAEDVVETLQLMSRIGVKEFHVRIHASLHVLPLLANETLARVLERADFASVSRPRIFLSTLLLIFSAAGCFL